MNALRRSLFALVGLLTFGPAAALAGDVTYLDQGWSKELREKVYRIPQGSFLMPYTWFLALEQPYSEALFRDDKYIESFRYLPEAKNPVNPDALPVGFTKGIARDGEPWIGLTCAACHTTQLTYRGKTVRVDGGSTLGDLSGFQSALVSALKATLAQPAKFERFAGRVLGDKPTPDQVKAFAARVRKHVTTMADWEAHNRTSVPLGFGHMDAVNTLLNSAAAAAQGEASNFRVPQAGVGVPSIWLTPEYDWMLYHAGIQNQLARGLGEVIVVFGDLKVTKAADGKLKYDCSADLKLLDELYTTNYSLKPPAWPEEVLGKLDAARAKRGAEVYAREGCAKCHAEKAPYPRTAPNAAGDTFIKINRVPLKEVGTDPGYAEYFQKRTATPGILAPEFEGTPLAGKETISAAFMFTAMLRKTMEAMLEQTVDDPKLRARMLGTQPLPALPRTEQEMEAMLEALRCYRAAPLAGVWATPPYLHNASVPNLYELLLPPEKRSKSFYLGNPEFDPAKVGYQTAPFDGGYHYDTTRPGYSNRGHTYGTTISEEDRLALVEYLKTL
jgi:hypothetical protein